MLNEISVITDHLFHQHDPACVNAAEIERTLAEYPYFAAARVLMAVRETEAEAGDAAVTANLFLHNPLRLNWLLQRATDGAIQKKEPPESAPQPAANEVLPPTEQGPEAASRREDPPQKEFFIEHLEGSEPTALQPEAHPKEDVQDSQPQSTPPEPAAQPGAAPQEEKTATNRQAEDAPIAFQSYHTIDYFASQGIRLQVADLGKDKLGQQLKSFTEWLRSMKKLPSTGSGASADDDPRQHQNVIQSAAHSIEAKEILTEAMAEVWAKQGNTERAIAIYTKLSLQNPAKSDYFAAKIDQLKAL